MTDLTPEQKKLQDKIRYILFELSLEGIDPDYTNTTEQLLSLIQEEKNKVAITMAQTIVKCRDKDGFWVDKKLIKALQALKQESKK